MNKIDPKTIKKPKGHEKYSDNDIDQCPIMQQQITEKEKETQQLVKKDIEKSPKKQKKPKGGCPFMPSDKKKNPPLGPMEESFDVAFVSPYEYFFSYCPLLDIALSDRAQAPREKKVFDAYPIYLKHSLMIDDDENMKKVREMEISKRFFCYDRFREKGNKEYYKGNYDIALTFYERAYHTFKWLSYKAPKDPEEEEEEKKKKEAEENKNQDETQFQEEQKENNEDEIQEDPRSVEDQKLMKELNVSEKEEQEVQDYIKRMKQEKKEFKQRYKNLMKTYDDETVVLHDGEDLTDAQDIDMRQSMLHTILMIMGICYMQLNHYKLAKTCFQEATVISDKATQIQYRQSQAIAYDKWSNLEELEEAKKLIETAIEMKKFEKIFNSGQPGMLKIMNLHNHDEAYREQAILVVKRIYDRTQWETEKVKEVLKQEKRIQEIKKQMIADGKEPREDNNFEIDEFEDKLEMMVVNEMVKKYYKAIEFYTETKDPKQVDAAKFQLQALLETLQEMMYFFEMKFDTKIVQQANEEFGLDLNDEITQKRLTRIAKKKAKELFDQGKNFNFDIFKWALDDVLKAKREYDAKKREMEDDGNDKKPQPSFVSTVVNNVLSPQFIFQLTAFFMFILILFQFTKSSVSLKDFMSITSGMFGNTMKK